MELTAGRRDAFWQLARYGVVGVIVTSFYTLVFAGLDSFSHASLQLCNLAGFVGSVLLGYVLHSRVTFRGHGERGMAAQLRFAVAALPGYGINAFWTWSLGQWLRLPHWTVQVPIWFVTPFAIFAINRWWVFR